MVNPLPAWARLFGRAWGNRMTESEVINSGQRGHDSRRYAGRRHLQPDFRADDQAAGQDGARAQPRGEGVEESGRPDGRDPNQQDRRRVHGEGSKLDGR